MSIYGIADLHFGFHADKPMDIFNKHWLNHPYKIEQGFHKHITAQDIVLIPGDISWGLTFEEAKSDLDFLKQLPGRKVLLRGNHDYWWSSLKKMKVCYPEFDFIQNNHVMVEDVAVCGCKGYLTPTSEGFQEEDYKYYIREVNRLKLSLDSVPKMCQRIIVMMHYPPIDDINDVNEFTKTIEAYPVTKVIYGHLHGEEGFKQGFKGMKNDILYQLVSSDYLDFTPKLIEKL